MYMGRPITDEDIDMIGEHMENMKKLTKTQLFLVITPSILFTSLKNLFLSFSVQFPFSLETPQLVINSIRNIMFFIFKF